MGLAIESLAQPIINGLRHQPENSTNGWYIWGGDFSEADDFFSPICVEDLPNYLSFDLTQYLNLPPGFRFLLDQQGYEDVWFDNNLLD